MAKSRKVTANRLRELLVYDPITGIWTWLVTMSSRVTAGSEAGTIDNHGYVRIGIDGKYYKAHRLAWFYMTGRWPRREIDHEDRVRHHNWWSNLRPATHAQNQVNSKIRSDNSLGIKGVYKNKKGRFIAQAYAGGRHHYIGTFETAEAAGCAYFEKAKELFGEFARA